MEYYVFNTRDAHEGWMDKCIVWWRSDGKGYTYDLNDAGVYTDEDRQKGYPSDKSCVYVPREIVDAHCRSPRLAWWTDAWKDPIKPLLEQFLAKRSAAIEHERQAS